MYSPIVNRNSYIVNSTHIVHLFASSWLSLIPPTFARMDYFRRLSQLLQTEKEEDRKQYELITSRMPMSERRENGMTWYPVAIKDTEIGRGDYLTVEVERTSYLDVTHQFRFGMTAALFSNHHPKEDRVEG